MPLQQRDNTRRALAITAKEDSPCSIRVLLLYHPLHSRVERVSHLGGRREAQGVRDEAFSRVCDSLVDVVPWEQRPVRQMEYVGNYAAACMPSQLPLARAVHDTSWWVLHGTSMPACHLPTVARIEQPPNGVLADMLQWDTPIRSGRNRC